MKNFIIKILQILVIFLLFELVYLLFNSNPLIVSPIAIVKNVISILLSKECYISIVNTFSKILLGFFIAIVLGVILALLSSSNKVISFAFSPIIRIIKITPVVSFIIFALIFFDSKWIVTLITCLMSLPIFYYNIYNGIMDVDKKILEMTQVFKLTKVEVIKTIYLPKTFLNFISAVETGIGYAIKSGITAEIIVLSKNTFGLYLYESKIYLDTLNLISYTIVIVIISLILEKVITQIFKMIAYKKGVIINDSTK